MTVTPISTLPEPAIGTVSSRDSVPRSSKPATGRDLFFLDGLRGLAALYVMVGHARWLLWEGYSTGFLKHPEAYSFGGKLLVYFFSLFRYGHAAVIFFFVLSGFVIHLRYARDLASEGPRARFGFWKYLLRRARRIYPPFLAALAITFILDVIGMTLGYDIYFQRTPYQLINQNFVPHHDFFTLFKNLAFLLGPGYPPFGTNGPVWSLKYEWWFYVLYPLFWWLTRRSVALATTAVALLFVCSFWPNLWPGHLFRLVFSLMLIWWFGALLADVYCGRLRCSWKLISLLAAFCVLIPFAKAYPIMESICWAVTFCGLLGILFYLHDRGARLRMLLAFKPLGDMSYTLYIIHLPILVLLSGWVMAKSTSRQLPAHFFWVFVGLAFCLLVAYALHFVVERPFTTRKARSGPAGATVQYSSSNA